ncbi:MAG TPA: site-2 protease family protein [Bryobacteraceae bacterium]|nr:site-2 protease family protein [Bryobacteraceae bacterium]
MFPEKPIEAADTVGHHVADRVVEPSRFAAPGARIHPIVAPRLWLHVLLFMLTLFTTTLVGAHMQYNFDHNLPFFDFDRAFDIFSAVLASPRLFFAGLPFSLTLLTILMAHELGHYVACVYYDVDATLPYFLPAPMPFTGTLGAFIRIRSAVLSKRVLFDIGIAGPLAGFIFLVPALGVGLAFSKVIPGINHQGAIQQSAPALEWLLRAAIFPGVRPDDIYLHPVARAAWVGMFATALNLQPVGQLDGGHIVYALAGKAHKWITWTFLGALVLMGFVSHNWWLWAALVFLFARNHPPVFDQTDIGPQRVRLGVLALVVFVLCFSIVPVIT